jgi:hypothetical protein
MEKKSSTSRQTELDGHRSLKCGLRKQIRSEKAVPLFQTTLTIGGGKPHGYAVAADGQRFLLPVPVRKDAPPITILLNWAER